MLELCGITKRFRDKVAVDRVELAFDEGSMTGVVGASGAGKSTLLRTINRLVEPDAGEVRWKGAPVSALKGARLRNWRRRCAMIFQNFQLAPRLDVITNVLIGSLHGRPLLPSLVKFFPTELRARAILELEALGLAHVALQRAETLSGGQQQRVAIARSMMQDPDILLADEPVASLDPVNADVVLEALARVNRERGITVIVNLHSIDLVRRYCPRVVGLAEGRVVFDGAAAEFDDRSASMIYGGKATERGRLVRDPEPAK